MIKNKTSALLFLFLFVFSNFSFAAKEEEQLLSRLKKFQWSNVLEEVPPCPSLECRLIWAAPAMGLGDAGVYAHRVKADGMQEYANKNGISQNFDAVKKLESLKPTNPWHFNKKYQIQIKNKSSRTKNEPKDMAVESRVFIGILVNDAPVDVIFDTGATLSLPAGSVAADTLDVLDIPANSPSALGKNDVVAFSTAKEVSIGDIKINNLMAKRKEGLPKLDINAVGLFGYDFLLRFDTVNVDLHSGVIKFNSSNYKKDNCSTMEMELDKNRIPAGLVVDIMIDNEWFKARIDTGANVDVLLHGKDIMPWKNGKMLNILAIDTAGNTTPLEEFEGNISLSKVTSPHTIVRTPFSHDTFKVTLGIKFFAGHNFTFDFKNSQFCLN